MAPSRRKGTSKAAAAAAARRQWKVGDLVLAKVKGYPAWPAEITDPEKWGYSADWKKVVVHFFGTKQIAFCNPADVEAFTEEKKQSLLVKRHGKGADFLRALQEIIDSFEKLKKQDQIDGNSEEVARENVGNSMESSANFKSKGHVEVPNAPFDSRLSSSNFTNDRNEQSLPVEDTLAIAQTDAMINKEEPSDCAAVAETPVPTIYSRRRSRELRSQSGISQRKETAVRRSRSLSKVESRRSQSFLVQYNDSGKTAGNISANVFHDGLLRRNKRNRRSPDTSEYNDFDSPACLDSIEDNGSEIVTVESDTISFNEGSTIDSGCKVEHSETVVECLEGDVELNLDLQIKAVVIKKKRKPNRKRATNDVTEPTVTVEKDIGMEVGVQSTSENSQTACVKDVGNGAKDDGDEHLPLVKRARVRMGKPSSAKEELNSLSNTEENTEKEVTVCPSEPLNTSLNCTAEYPASRELLMVNGVLDNISPSRNCSQFPGYRSHLWKAKKDQSFGCSVDGEAALPPSKRLHRALEAMSANAAEEGQACTDALSTMEIVTNNEPSTSSISRCPHVTSERRTEVGLSLDDVDSIDNNMHQDGASGLSACLNPLITEENNKSSIEIDCHGQRVESSSNQNDESCQDVILNTEDCDDGMNDNTGSDVNHTVITAIHSQSSKHLLSDLDRSEVDIGPNLGSAKDFLSQKGEFDAINTEPSNSEAQKLDKEIDASEHTVMCLGPGSSSNVNGIKVSPHKANVVLQSSVEANGCEDAKSLELPLDDCKGVDNMSEVVKEVMDKQHTEDPVSVSCPNDHATDASGMRSSPCLTDGGDSLVQASPATISICQISTSDSSNVVQNNSSCSPDLPVHQKTILNAPTVDEEVKFDVVADRPKSMGKNAEAHVGLSSFEAMLGTLTRTKESIGRATRVAIECAKFGIASKVVEALVRFLETESSLHRRVDLFFLVDSITQCSRGLKGDVGDKYLSVIQSFLPRLLSAAAPPGNSAHENRRQCLKVLRLWLERRILPETIIRHHMRELDSHSGSSSSGFSRRSSRTERSLDDPLREMEGMLVDEYGSNSSFQLPGFCMPRMLKDEDDGSDSDGGSFEAVTPEHNLENHDEYQMLPATEKRRHILEDVDGELEMEDVAPSCEGELNSSYDVGGNATQISNNHFEQQYPLPFAPPLPQDVPPSSPPLPSSPPPPPPPPPAVPPPCSMPNHYISGLDSKHVDSHNMQDNMVQSQSNAPRSNGAIPDAVQYPGPDCRDSKTQMPESNSCSFSSYSVQSARNVPQSDSVAFHNKGHPLRPPHPPPSNQFSYVHGDQHFKSRREAAPPPSYSNRFHYTNNGDRENFYDSHERTQPASNEFRDSWRKPAMYERDSWRYPPHSFSDHRYPDRGKYYAPGAYVGPPCEPSRVPNQGWRFPPRSMNHRNSLPFRPPFEGAIPAAGRGPSYWRPR